MPLKAQYLEWMDELLAVSDEGGGGGGGAWHQRLFYGDPAEQIGGGKGAERRQRQERLERARSQQDVKHERDKDRTEQAGPVTLTQGAWNAGPGVTGSAADRCVPLPQLMCRKLESTWRDQLDEFGLRSRTELAPRSECDPKALSPSRSSAKLAPPRPGGGSQVTKVEPQRTRLPRLGASASLPAMATRASPSAMAMPHGAAAAGRAPQVGRAVSMRQRQEESRRDLAPCNPPCNPIYCKAPCKPV